MAPVQRRLPGFEVRLVDHAETLTLHRGVLAAVAAAAPGYARSQQIAADLGASIRAVAAELAHLRAGGLVASRQPAPGFTRGLLWQVTSKGQRALQGPDLTVAQRAVLEALCDGPLATSRLAAAASLSVGVARRAAAGLRAQGLCVYSEQPAARVMSPAGGSERVHEITDAGRGARRAPAWALAAA